MPALPATLQEKYISIHGLSAYDAAMICADKEDAAFYEAIAANTNNYKATANWITGPIRNYCNEKEISIQNFPLDADRILELIQFTESGKIHFNTASTKLMDAMIADKDSLPETLAASMNLLQENNTDALQKWVDETIASMPEKVKEYRAGKKGLIGLFAGQVKKLSKGKADMETVTKMLEASLNPSERGTSNAV